MYENGKPNCPVKSLKLYLQLRNSATNDFFQLPAEQSIPPKYTKEPSGINTLSKLMKNISTSLNLPRVYTNHCVRATTDNTCPCRHSKPGDNENNWTQKRPEPEEEEEEIQI